MPHINEMKKSSFLKKEDCGAGILVTIKEVSQENVAKEGAPEELKWCCFFNELEKPMVLNSTNVQLIAQITKQENTDNWTGWKIVLFNDPSVSYSGKMIGGIRVRAPRGQAAKHAAPVQSATAPAAAAAAPAPAPAAALAEPEEDSVPF